MFWRRVNLKLASACNNTRVRAKKQAMNALPTLEEKLMTAISLEGKAVTYVFNFDITLRLKS